MDPEICGTRFPSRPVATPCEVHLELCISDNPIPDLVGFPPWYPILRRPSEVKRDSMASPAILQLLASVRQNADYGAWSGNPYTRKREERTQIGSEATAWLMPPSM